MDRPITISRELFLNIFRHLKSSLNLTDDMEQVLTQDKQRNIEEKNRKIGPPDR